MENIKENIHKDFQNLKQNKSQYFNEFYNNNYNLVYRISFSILKDKDNSEDVTQNVFEKIYKLPNDKLAEEFESTWLYTVTKNESLQYMKKNKFNIPLDEKIDTIKKENNEINDIEENEDYKNIVKKLNKKQEQIVSLKVLSDFTFKEIGEILSMPTATVQWYYYKSIKSLKIAISNLAMFVVAILIGLKLGIKADSNINTTDEPKNKKEESSNKDIYQDEKGSDTHTQSSSETNSSSKSDAVSNITSIQDSNIEDSQAETADLSNEVFALNNNNISIGIFSLAGIFLLISIIFSIIFIKHQQNSAKKSSKK